MRFPNSWPLVFPLLLVAGCSQPNVYQEPPPPTVNVATPVVQTVTNYLEETATTEAVAKVEIRARVEGTIESVNFEPGAFVEKGDLLYEIEPEVYEAQVDFAAAELESAKARVKEAEAQKIREEKMQAQNATSDAAVLAAQAEFESAKAAVSMSEAKLKQAEIDQQYTQVSTPIKGRVGKTMVKEGNLVGGIQATLLTTVIQYDPIYANFNISERMLLRLLQDRQEDGEVDKKSIKIFLSRENDEDFPFEGVFDYADLTVDQSTGTFLIRGIFKNPERRIIPGLFVTIRMPLEVQENAVLIPERALGEDQAGKYVLIVNAENMVERRTVKTGVKLKDMIVINEGLSAEETFVVDGLQRARPGAKVAPEEIELEFESSGNTVQSGKMQPPPPSEQAEDLQVDPDNEDGGPKAPAPPAENTSEENTSEENTSAADTTTEGTPADTSGNASSEEGRADETAQPDASSEAGSPPDPS